MKKQFTAEIKQYDPDYEEEATFDTWEEAEQWLLDQQVYGLSTMRINNRRVRFHAGHAVSDEPEGDTALNPLEMVLRDMTQAGLKVSTFRPQPTRGAAPTNPATLAEKDDE